jgi:hypothetical protein
MRLALGALLAVVLCGPAWTQGHRGGCCHHGTDGQGCTSAEQCKNCKASGRRMGRGRQAPQNAPAPQPTPTPQK